MNINQLQYFLTLSQQEHMSIAAEFLNISEAALSKSIRNLETELGVELFDRKGRRIRLNQNGMEFQGYARRILKEFEDGRRHLRQHKFEYRGRIRISCFAFADGIMECVTEYMHLNPGIQVEVLQGLSGEAQMSEHTDFLLNGYMNAEFEQNWISQPVFTENYCLLISPRYREYPQNTEMLALQDMQDDSFIGDYIASDIVTNNEPTLRICMTAGFRPRIIARTDDFMTKIRLADNGLGIVLLPKSCVRNAKLLSPSLRCFVLSDYPDRRTVYLMRRKETHLSDAALDFWDFACSYYK